MTVASQASRLTGPTLGALLGIPLVAVLHRAGYAGDVPLWLLTLLIVVSCMATNRNDRLDPVSARRTYAAMTAVLTIQSSVVFLVGWLPMIAAAHLVVIAPAIRKHGSSTALPITAISVVLIIVGQALVAAGWVQSYVSAPQVYALTSMAAVLQLSYGKALGDSASEREIAEAVVLSSERRFRSLVQRSFDVVMVLDGTGHISEVSPSCLDILGYRSDELLGTNGTDLCHPDELAAAVESLSAVLDNGGPAKTEFRFRHGDGSWRWSEAHVENLLDDPDVAGVVVNLRDVTERKTWEQRISHEASHDALTGLMNRAEFLEQLQVALQKASHDGSMLAVLFVDLDGFKSVNDNLGHHCGDIVLKNVARRLQSCLRPVDTIARFAGDEFTILVPDLAHALQAQMVVDRITASLSTSIEVGDNHVRIGASVGVAVTVAGDQPPEILLQEADAAMYEVKRSSVERTAMIG